MSIGLRMRLNFSNILLSKEIPKRNSYLEHVITMEKV